MTLHRVPDVGSILCLHVIDASCLLLGSLPAAQRFLCTFHALNHILFTAIVVGCWPVLWASQWAIGPGVWWRRGGRGYREELTTGTMDNPGLVAMLPPISDVGCLEHTRNGRVVEQLGNHGPRRQLHFVIHAVGTEVLDGKFTGCCACYSHALDLALMVDLLSCRGGRGGRGSRGSRG